MQLKELPRHHAVLIVNSERDTVGTTLFEELQKLSPAHRFFNHKVLDIDMARNIISWAQTPYNDEKIGLVSFNTIGLEAQNALLKILEEPRIGVKFILLTSNKSNLIDTVLSRVITVEKDRSYESLTEAEKFLSTQINLRMKLPYIVDILSRVEKINNKERKDKETLHIFILSLATSLKNIKAEPKYIQETLEVASYVADPSTSGKALLEYLSLLLPVTK